MGAYVPMLIMGGAAAGLAKNARDIYAQRDQGITSAADIANQFSSITPPTPVAPTLGSVPAPPPLPSTLSAPQMPTVPNLPNIDLNTSPDTLLSSSFDTLLGNKRKADAATTDRYRALTQVIHPQTHSLMSLLGS